MTTNCKVPRTSRNIIFFGETGVGKSSIINLLEANANASVSNDARPCTQTSRSYEINLCGTSCTVWDTRGLEEGSYLRRFFSRSKKELKNFLKERHSKKELDLLVYCVRGSRATKALLKHYNSFCNITRRLAAPVVIVVTHLEREPDMEDWWTRNLPRFMELEMEFDGHACITSLRDHARSAESSQRLSELFSRTYQWEAETKEGSYFGSPVRKTATPHTASRMGFGLRRSVLVRIVEGGSQAPHSTDRNIVGGSESSTPTSSERYSFHTPAESPQMSRPSTPVVQPPTPIIQDQVSLLSLRQVVRSTHTPPEDSSAAVPPITTRFLPVSDPTAPHSEDSESMEFETNSMFCRSLYSSRTSQSDIHAQGREETEPPRTNEAPRRYVLERLSEMPYKHLTATVKRKKEHATLCGAFGDIWECELIEGEHSRVVAVKAIRLPQPTTFSFEERSLLQRQEKKFRRELKVWEALHHPNIVPLIGLVPDFGDLPSMVSPWYTNGCLTQYLAYHDGLKLSERHSLLSNIAAGLCYLHNNNVIHGDLHSGNVLIDENGVACLTDFGLSLVNDFVGTSYLRSNVCGAIQFADPAFVKAKESSGARVQGQEIYPKKTCDIYSFGGLILHVLSGKRPYDGQSTTTIVVMVVNGERPDIGDQNEEHQLLIRRCWNPDEGVRPSAEEITRWFQSSNDPLA